MTGGTPGWPAGHDCAPPRCRNAPPVNGSTRGAPPHAPLSAQVATEAIAGSAHRFDQPVVAGRRERLAQPADVDVHGALLDEHIVAPDFVEQLSAAIHSLNVGHEEMQHAELDVAEVDVVAAAAHPVHD